MKMNEMSVSLSALYVTKIFRQLHKKFWWNCTCIISFWQSCT